MAVVSNRQRPCFTCLFRKSLHTKSHDTVSGGRSSLAIETTTITPTSTTSKLQVPDNKRLLIHWKGEINDKYSFHFRHFEFAGALEAVCDNAGICYRHISFENALLYDGKVEMKEFQRTYFEESMQYIQGIENIPMAIEAAKRCSLVHALYQIVAIQDDYQECCDAVLANSGFADMYVGADNQNYTWCLRVRQYGGAQAKGKRHGERARSMQEERKALMDLTPVLSKLGGGVDLQNPDCHIYVFNGLKGQTVLARRLASGPPVFRIAPSTRICITNTPLCPIAAFSLCNIAGVRDGHLILDPYAGSCTTLLAAAMMAPGAKTVGIEIAHQGIVNRDDVMKDFETRNLTPPLALIYGDSTDESIRDDARSCVGEGVFDVIVTDPPYGIRESSNYNEQLPLSELCDSIARDREAGKRLLKKGGKFVAFVPCTEEERIEDCLPNASKLDKAGLQLLQMIEQPLNEKLSRWLVCFQCVR